ncbi:hypothetical protein D0869_02164 [Hortaea werneckii]|uniref:Nephrocystin 3-like N-terminal domain-containing protein n=1 Tax=Hortaea werneckii TaxID=91943 RepID=A0A3M6XA31_HORWE|nr:hypothetical protein D0869_02164 [Hortaea werneckii]
MEFQQPAVGPISRGIRVCQELLSHDSYWKDSDPYISSIYIAISRLSETLILLKSTLEGGNVGQKGDERIEEYLQYCESATQKLEADWRSARRSHFPFRKVFLQKILKHVAELQEGSSLALEVLHPVPVQQSVEYRKIVAWLSAPDPWTNHNSARVRHEDSTGSWLLQSAVYQTWKSNTGGRVWLSGKAGCGKTVLCSTVIEDIHKLCQHSPDTAYTMFYFSFSDKYKQASEYLIRSLVAQLGWREPGYSMLRQAYETSHRGVPMSMFLLLDALDEFPEEHTCQEDVLKQIEFLTSSAPNLNVFATSREHPQIRDSMDELGFKSLKIVPREQDDDIRTYVSMQLSHDYRSKRLDPATLHMIENTILRRADGIRNGTDDVVNRFRFAYCQIHELKKLKSLRPENIRLALEYLPRTLDETHERMLSDIGEKYQQEALTLLQWLAYAKSPPTLDELAEASSIDPDEQKCVDADNRGGIEEVLNLLSGLIAVDDSLEEAATSHPRLSSTTTDEPIMGPAKKVSIQNRELNKNTRIRLAHFSVIEYLQSKSILNSRAKRFHLVGEAGHSVLAQSCLAYLRHYSSSGFKTSTTSDFESFSLLRYAAHSWFYHSALQGNGQISRELSLLRQDGKRNEWLLIHDPDKPWHVPFRRTPPSGSAMYYAALLGLQSVVEHLLECGADINVQGGYYGNALQAISSVGRIPEMHMLLDKGADVNARGGHFGSALQAASYNGLLEAMRLLLDRHADVNARGGHFGSALQAASYNGLLEAIRLLLDRHADVNARGGHFGSALQAASYNGLLEAMRLLLNRHADVNAQGGCFGNALQAASYGGHTKAIQLLLDCGADVNAHGGEYGNALYIVSERGHKEALDLLLDKGTDVNSQGGEYGSPLQAASVRGDVDVVQSLLDRGADPRATGGIYSTALHAASSQAFPDIVLLLLRHGADVEARSESFETPLQVACVTGATEMAKLLLDLGANPNAAPGSHGTCLRAAALSGADEIVRQLLRKGAELNEAIPQNDVLFVASRAGSEHIVRILLENGVSPNMSALEKASEEGHSQVVDLLILAGAVASTQNPEQTKSILPHTKSSTDQRMLDDTSDDDSDVETHAESVFSSEKFTVTTLPTTLSSHLRQGVIQRKATSPTETSVEPEHSSFRRRSLRHGSEESSHMALARSFDTRDLGNTDTPTETQDVKHVPNCSESFDEEAICSDATQPKVADGDARVAKQFFTPKRFVFRGMSKLHQAALHWCRPRLANGFSRVEWSCTCGQSFWGDFQHTEREDLDRLISDFRRNDLQVMIVAASGTTAVHGDNARPQDIDLTSGSSLCGSKNVASATKPNVQQNNESNVILSQVAVTSFLHAQRPVYLELCINRSSMITRLGEIMLVPGRGDPLIRTDQQLFDKLSSRCRAPPAISPPKSVHY